MDDYIVGREFMQNCFSDLWTLYLTLIGILLSIFTLLYSFIQNRKDELKLIVEQIKINGITPLISQKKRFAILYIRRLVRINKTCFGLLLISFIMNAFCWCGMRLSFVFNNIVLLRMLIIAIAFTLLIGCYILYLGHKFIKQYKSDTKI